MKLTPRIVSVFGALGLGMALVVIPSGTAQAADTDCNLALTAALGQSQVVGVLVQIPAWSLAASANTTLNSIVASAETGVCSDDIQESSAVADGFVSIKAKVDSIGVEITAHDPYQLIPGLVGDLGSVIDSII